MSPDGVTKSIETETECDVTQDVILQQQINDVEKQVNELNTGLLCKNKELLETKKSYGRAKISH